MIATASCTVEIAGTGTISEIKDGVFMQHERGFQHGSMEHVNVRKEVRMGHKSYEIAWMFECFEGSGS